MQATRAVSGSEGDDRGGAREPHARPRTVFLYAVGDKKNSEEEEEKDSGGRESVLP